MHLSDFAYKAKGNLHADLRCDDIFCCCKLSGQTKQEGSREEAEENVVPTTAAATSNQQLPVPTDTLHTYSN